MIVLKFPATLTLLSMGYCYWRIDTPRSKECSTYKVSNNVTVVPILCDEHGSITDNISKELCVQHCNEMAQCTAVMADTTGLTSRCCYLTQNPVIVAPGNSTLYFRHDVTTVCVFGYDPNTGCQRCLQDYMVSAEYIFVFREGHDSHDQFLEFNLGFGGPDCSEIMGTVRDDATNSLEVTVTGAINRTSETWYLTDRLYTYRARLVDGGMTNGTVGRTIPETVFEG